MAIRERRDQRKFAQALLLFTVIKNKYIELHGEIDEVRLEEAFELAYQAHSTQKRKDGTPYIIHPLEVALICVDLNMDEDSLIAAILHDTVEDTPIKLHQLRQRFGDNVANMVDSLTKITKIDLLARFTGRDKASAQARNLQKLFVSVTRDTRVIVIKLADRLHNMQTLGPLAEHKRQRISLETLEFYIPIARRLGLGAMVRELEDLVFMHLHPDEYEELREAMEPVFAQYQPSIDSMVKYVSEEFPKQDLVVDQVYARRKHLYSIYRKMKRYNLSHEEVPSKIYDLIATRIIIAGSPMDCYKALGLLHLQYRPIFDRFRDFIAYPKDNGYQTLHTTVINTEGMRIECQIRTVEMDLEATKGIAAHWRYKETGMPAGKLNKDSAWIEFIRELTQERMDTEEFIAHSRDEFLADQVLVLSPKGEVVSLPVGSTPIDFAYYIHTDLGHSIRQAKVNGTIVPLDYTLQNGDVVEIITLHEKAEDPPRPEFLAMVRSPKSMMKLRRHFKRQPRADRIAAGRAVLRQYIMHEGLYPLNLTANEKLAQLLRLLPVRNIDEVYEMVALGKLLCEDIVDKLKQIHESRLEEAEEETGEKVRGSQGETALIGLGGELNICQKGGMPLRGKVELMNCCTPVLGDRIYGILDRRTRRFNVHRVECRQLQREVQHGELVELAWLTESSLQPYPARIEIVSLNRVGMLFEVMQYLSKRNINLGGADFSLAPSHIGQDRYAHFELVVEVTSSRELEQCLAGIRQIRDVREVSRQFKYSQEYKE
jgi:GTP pyrophosphokinase